MGAMTSQPWPSSRMLAQLRFDLGDELADVCLIERGLRAARHGRGRQARRTVGEIECEREQRDEEGDGHRHGRGPEREGGTRSRGAVFPGGGEQAAGDLGPGGGRLGLVDQTARALGFDLVELMAIDGKRAGRGRRLGVLLTARRTTERGQHHGQHRGCQQCEEEPEEHVLPIKRGPVEAWGQTPRLSGAGSTATLEARGLTPPLQTPPLQ